MSLFFYGWRRKAGCVLLVVGAVSMGAWIRSIAMNDILTIEYGDTANIIQSTDGSLSWERGKSFSSPHTNIQWQSFDLEHLSRLSPWVRTGIMPQMEWGGMEFGKSKIGKPPRFGWITLPYWLIMTAVTLLSAFLLLCPNKRKAKLPPQDSTATESKFSPNAV